jgi:hypothetical protein
VYRGKGCGTAAFTSNALLTVVETRFAPDLNNGSPFQFNIRLERDAAIAMIHFFCRKITKRMKGSENYWDIRLITKLLSSFIITSHLKPPDKKNSIEMLHEAMDRRRWSSAILLGQGICLEF